MKQQFVVLIGFLLMLLMVYPLVTIMDREDLLWGLPVQTIYIFGLWIFAVFVLALVIARKKMKR